MGPRRLGIIVAAALVLGLASACGALPRTQASATTPEPHSSAPVQPGSAPDPRAWDLFLSGSVVGTVHASLAHACGGGGLPTGNAALLLSSDFELTGGEYDVFIWVMADKLVPGTYPAQIHMSKVDAVSGPWLYQGSGTARILEADAQFAGSVTGSMVANPDAPNAPALGALRLDGQWQCPRLTNSPIRTP
jgi:hypothetical protein